MLAYPIKEFKYHPEDNRTIIICMELFYWI